MTLSFSRRIALAGATFLTLSAPAFALDGQDLVKKINAALNLEKGGLTPASIDISNDTVTLKAVTIVAPGATDKAPSLGDITMDGVAELEDGGYTIEKVTFQNINVTNDGATLTASDLYLNGVSVPGDKTTDSIYGFMLYDKAHVGPVKVTKDGKDVFTLAEAAAEMTLEEGDKGLTYSFKADKFSADLSGDNDPKSKEAIEKLGLTTLSGSLSTSGSWKVDDGALNVDSIKLAVDKVGTLDMGVAVSGYTLKMIKSLQETLKSMQDNPNKDQANQAAGLALMGLMQQLSFVKANIRYDDDGITKKALDYAGSQQTPPVSGDQLSQQLQGLVPIMMAQLNMPELQNQVSGAVATFLKQPKSLTVKAEPNAPVAVPMIMGAAIGAPQTLPQVLGVKVSAND